MSENNQVDYMAWRKTIRKQLHNFENKVSLSDEEKNLLRRWVKEGNSPYDNPYYVYDENGQISSYIFAFRFVNGLQNNNKNS